MGNTKELSKEVRLAQGWNGLQSHRKEARWQGDNYWCLYYFVARNINDPSVTLSLELLSFLAAWSYDDHENSGGLAQNFMEELAIDLQAAGTAVTKNTIDNTLRCNGSPEAHLL